MKRIFSILLILVLLMGLMPVMPTVALAESYATVTSENGLGVNLREGPGTGYKKIDAYPVGTTVQVLQQGAEWSQIQLGDSVVGWMMSRFLIFGVTGGGSSSGSSTGSTNAYVVSDNGLRVWLRASAGGSRLFLNAAGTPVEVITYDAEWCYIRIGATYGYMKTQYLSVGQTGEEGEGESTPIASGRVTEVEINYTHPVVLDTLTAIVTSENAIVDYEWYVCYPDGMGGYKAGTLLGTEATFEVLTRYADCKIYVKVTGKDGSTGTATSDMTAPVQISKGLKAVEIDKDGAPVVGETLTAKLVPSSALGDYSWRVGGVEVSTESTYTVQESDLGKMIQLRVTGIGGFVGTVACSADAAVVSDKALQSVELNKLNPVVGDKLSATVLPEGANYTYQWLANGEVVGTSATYKVQELDLGKQITVNVTGVDPYTGTVSATTTKVSSGKLTSVTITGTPMVGETVYAKLNPEKATAIYEWYVGDMMMQRSILSSFEVANDSWVDEEIMVRAYPSGVYSLDDANKEGFVEYKLSEKIFADTPLYSIAMLNTTPVVHDEITVELQPEKADDVQDEFTYVWFVGTETAAEHSNKYTVKPSDIGKKIRVQVIGKDTSAGDYTDKTVYSAWSSVVVDTKKISGITIKNLSKDVSAIDNNPIVGDELYATVIPEAADPYVTYTWLDSKGNVLEYDSNTYIVDAADEGHRITVKAEVTAAIEDLNTFVYNYTGEAKATTGKVKAANPLIVDFYIPEPEAGITPTFSTTRKIKDADGKEKTIATAKIEWLQYEGGSTEKASFDKFGHFEPGVEYVAKLTVTPKNDTSLYLADVTVNGGATYKDPDDVYNTKVFYYDFAPTAGNTITDYYIGNLEAPVLSAGVWQLDEECYNTQVEAIGINWTYYPDDSLYVAEINLDVLDSTYDFSNVPENAFKVNGAYKTENAANSPIVYAYYEIEHELFVDTDKSEVYLDGYNRVIVQCTAYMTNYTDPLTTVKWEIVSAKVDGTTISQDGQLVIGMYEVADRVLTIRATVEIAGELYTVEKDINLISGTATDTAINITFKQYATRVEDNATAIYKAIVSNSTDGCNIFAITGAGEATLLVDGVFDPAALGLTAGDYAVIKAISNEDHSVTATLMVEIIDSSLGLGTNQVYNESGEELVAEEEAIMDGMVSEEIEAVEMPEEMVTEEVVAEEVVAEEVITEEVIAEEIVTEEIVTEEVMTEEVAVEITEEVVVEEETEPVVEETVVEEEVIDPSVIIITDTVSGETIETVEEPVAEEVVVEEPVVEETVVEETIVEETVVEETVTEEPEAEEIPEDVTIAIKDTVTGEVVEENIPVNSNKPVEEQEPAKNEEITAEEELAVETPDEVLDALEGEDVGQSVENDAQIVISFVKSASEVKRGNTAEFAVEVTGSDAGVQWMLRRSKNADGMVVSSISQDGVLTVSADETAEKLVVIAASTENSDIRARWIVAVPQKAASISSDAAEEAMVEEILVEDTLVTEQPEEVEAPVEETQPETEEEIVAEDEGLSDDILKQIEEELAQLEEQQSVLNFF